VAHGGEKEKGGVRRLGWLLLALLLLTGCEALNDALVRQSLKDGGLSSSVNRRIRQRLERNLAVPESRPKTPAPAFLDQG
jgi:hypothetical protein